MTLAASCLRWRGPNAQHVTVGYNPMVTDQSGAGLLMVPVSDDHDGSDTHSLHEMAPMSDGASVRQAPNVTGDAASAVTHGDHGEHVRAFAS